MQKISLHEQITSLLLEFEMLGYSPHTIIHPRLLWSKLAKIHDKLGKIQLDDGVVNDFLADLRNNNADGHIGHRTLIKRERHIRLLQEYCTSGRFDISKPKGGYNTYLPVYTSILSKISAYDGWPKTTKSQVLTCTRTLFYWLTTKGFDDINSIKAVTMRMYLAEIAEKCSGIWLKNTKIMLKKLFTYLHETGYLADDLTALLSFPVLIKRKILPALTHREIAAILSAIDRTTTIGSRDYAILLIAAVTGLRASDIVSLKFSNIDLISGEIFIKQQKTGKSLALPLTIDIAEAIKNYVRYGRPQSDSPEIFLRSYAPYRRLQDHRAIANIFNKYALKSGLERRAFDGKGFHSIRRSVGLNMVAAEVPVTTVAQTLGHYGTDTVKQYIALDTAHLRECTLDFAGIKPEHGGAI